MKRRKIDNFLSRKKEMVSVLSAAGLFLISIFLILFCLSNFLPRTINLISIYGSDDNFQKIRDEITSENSKKLSLEKSISSNENELELSESGDEYYRELISQAKSNGLFILSFKEMKSETKDEFSKATISMELSGDYAKLIKFIKRLESAFYPIAIRSLKATASNSMSSDLKCEIIFTIYRNVYE